MANLLDVIREEFFSRLSTQTNWGRNQIKELYTQVQLDVLSSRVNNAEILYDSPLNEEIIGINHTANKNIERIKELGKVKKESIYTPQSYHTPNTNEVPDTDPFHDDKDINKGSL